MNPDDTERLLDAAKEAAARAYAPYSGFRVGAAVLAEDGGVYRGCNVENASYGLTVCAERNAVCAAVGAGNRRLRAIAIVASGDTPPYPCGACRQVLAEFFAPDAPVIVATLRRPAERQVFLLGDLLPHAFSFPAAKPGPESGACRITTRTTDHTI